MPIFERPPLDSLPPAKDRWTPVYLEHGRLEIDDSSVKWIDAEGNVCRLPVATISALIMGPGTTLTHAAIKVCAQSNTPVFWMGEEGMHFYAYGLTPNHANSMARLHGVAWAHPKLRNEVARRMFLHRFPQDDVTGQTVKRLRGMEGKRVRHFYAELGRRYGVTWKGRAYDRSQWDLATPINRALSVANASLYALTAATTCALGFIPQLGFVHEGGSLPFVYDIADLYKHETSWPAAFEAVSIETDPSSKLVRRIFKRNIETARVLGRMPREVKALFNELDFKGKLPASIANPFVSEP